MKHLALIPPRNALMTISALALVACAEDPPVIASGNPIIANTDDVDRFAITVLESIQPASIAESREYCGYIYRTDSGALAATPPARGTEDYCDLPWPDDSVLASYHTHGSYSDVYYNELPSTDDLEGDFEAGIDGYVGTPAGRVWYNSVMTETTTLLCARACITADPNDDPADSGVTANSYTLAELRAIFE